MDGFTGSWLDEELTGCDLPDKRLSKRLRKLLAQVGGAMGQSIPFACQDWSNAKAAYRFLSNDRVSEADILAGHFESTRGRAGSSKGLIFVLHDTTEFTYEREAPGAIGITKSVNSGRDKAGRVRSHTVCGILMHSSLAMTREGLPLGLAAVKFWTRQKFKGTAALKKKINPTRCRSRRRKASAGWTICLSRQSFVHIGDRESDIYELFCLAQELGTHFLVRTCVNRRAGDGDHTVADEMDEVTIKGLHRIEVRDDDGEPDQAVLEIRYRKIRVLPPIGKWKRYPALTLSVIQAEEAGAPRNRKRISWKLITDLPVRSKRQAVEKLEWYSMRWKIEVFHKILKSGCKAEDSKLRTAHRLANLIAVFCIVSWRVFWMTMLNRTAPDTLPSLALTTTEIRLLDGILADRPTATQKTLSHYLIKIARLGGYLARAADPPPGNVTMWRGLSRLRDIELGARIQANCG